MKMFIAGTVFGIVIATVGIGGILKMGDNVVEQVQHYSKEASK